MSLPQVVRDVEYLLDGQKKIHENIDQILARIGTPTPGNQNLEAVAAKIINDISDKIDKCDCNKEIKELLAQSNEVTPFPDTKEKAAPFLKYSFQNYFVGNEELGSSVA